MSDGLSWKPKIFKLQEELEAKFNKPHPTFNEAIERFGQKRGWWMPQEEQQLSPTESLPLVKGIADWDDYRKAYFQERGWDLNLPDMADPEATQKMNEYTNRLDEAKNAFEAIYGEGMITRQGIGEIGGYIFQPLKMIDPRASWSGADVGWTALDIASFGVFGKVAKPIVKAVKGGKVTEIGKLASYEQKLEGHRLARRLGMNDELYKLTSEGVTGKKSMATMTTEEADKFIARLKEDSFNKFGDAEIKLPYEYLPDKEAKPAAHKLALELSEYLGAPVKTYEPIIKATQKIKLGQKISDNFMGYVNRWDRVERLVDKTDGYKATKRLTQGGTETVIGGKMMQTFINPIEKATNTRLFNQGLFRELLSSKIKELGLTWKQLMGAKLPITQFGLVSKISRVELSTAERIGVYLHSLNPDNLRHVVYGYSIDEDTVKYIVNTLTPQERKLGDYILDLYKKNQPEIQKVYKMATNREMKIVDNYTPIILKGDARPLVDILKDEMTYRYIQKFPSTRIKKAFTKARTGKATQKIELDAFNILFRRMDEMEHYKAFTPVIRDLQRIIGDVSFKTSLIQKEGKSTYDVLTNWLKDVAASDPLKARDWGEKLLQQLRVNATAGVLGFKITTLLNQFPAFLVGASAIGNVPALKGLFAYISHPSKTMELIKKISPQMWERTSELKKFELKIERAVNMNKGERLLQTVRDTASWLTVTADRVVANSIWRGAFDDAIKKGIGEKLAARYADRIVQRTQAMWNVKDLAEMYRSGEAMRMWLAFTNQLNNQWNFLRHDIYGAYKAGVISNSELVKKSMEGIVLQALLIGWISRSRPSEDVGEFATDISANVLASVPLIGTMLSAALQGYRETGAISFEAMNELSSAMYNISKGTWDKAMVDIPEFIGYATGLPISQGKRIADALIDISSGKSEDWMRLFWSEYARRRALEEEESRRGSSRGSSSRGGSKR